MGTCNQSNIEINNIQLLALEIANEIISFNESNLIHKKVFDVLNLIIRYEDSENYLSPFYTIFINTLIQFDFTKDRKINIMIKKIQQEIIYNFMIKENNQFDIKETQNNKKRLTEGEERFFVLENGKMKIKEGFNPDGKSKISFIEGNQYGKKVQKTYKIDLKTGYVLNSFESEISTNEESLNIPYSNDFDINIVKSEFDKFQKEIFESENDLNIITENDL